jgi:hypothetical protein
MILLIVSDAILTYNAHTHYLCGSFYIIDWIQQIHFI